MHAPIFLLLVRFLCSTGLSSKPANTNCCQVRNMFSFAPAFAQQEGAKVAGAASSGASAGPDGPLFLQIAVPFAVLAAFHASAFASQAFGRTGLWQKYGRRLHLWLARNQVRCCTHLGLRPVPQALLAQGPPGQQPAVGNLVQVGSMLTASREQGWAAHPTCIWAAMARDSSLTAEDLATRLGCRNLHIASDWLPSSWGPDACWHTCWDASAAMSWCWLVQAARSAILFAEQLTDVPALRIGPSQCPLDPLTILASLHPPVQPPCIC